MYFQDHICTLTMEDLLKLSLDIANGCRHLEEKHFVHRYVPEYKRTINIHLSIV